MLKNGVFEGGGGCAFGNISYLVILDSKIIKRCDLVQFFLNLKKFFNTFQLIFTVKLEKLGFLKLFFVS